MKILEISILTGYLLIASVKDIISKRLSLVFLIAGIIPVVICIGTKVYMTESGNVVTEVFVPHAIGLLIGLLFVLISHLSGGNFGMGDALIFCICGAAVGYKMLLIAAVSAFLLGALYAVAMFAMGRFNRKSSFAFVPFIMLGYVMAEVLNRGI